MIDKSRLTALALAIASMLPIGALAQEQGWVTAWAASQQGLGQGKISNATVRMVARVTASGDSVRIRLDNTFGTAPVVLGKATIGLRVRGPAVAAGLIKPLTFGGKEQVTIAPGGTALSDAAALRVENLQPCVQRRTQAGSVHDTTDRFPLAGGEGPDVHIFAGENPAVDGDGQRDGDGNRIAVDFLLDGD